DSSNRDPLSKAGLNRAIQRQTISGTCVWRGVSAFSPSHVSKTCEAWAPGDVLTIEGFVRHSHIAARRSRLRRNYALYRRALSSTTKQSTQHECPRCSAARFVSCPGQQHPDAVRKEIFRP